MRPPSIRMFERVYWLSVLIGVAAALWSFFDLSAIVPADVPPDVRAAIPIMVAVGGLIGIAINILLWFFIARRGAEIAKWIFVILFVVGLVGVLRALFGHHVVLPPLVRIMAPVQMLLQAICLWLLFRPDATAWFRRSSPRVDL